MSLSNFFNQGVRLPQQPVSPLVRQMQNQFAPSENVFQQQRTPSTPIQGPMPTGDIRSLQQQGQQPQSPIGNLPISDLLVALRQLRGSNPNIDPTVLINVLRQVLQSTFQGGGTGVLGVPQQPGALPQPPQQVPRL